MSGIAGRADGELGDRVREQPRHLVDREVAHARRRGRMLPCTASPTTPTTVTHSAGAGTRCGGAVSMSSQTRFPSALSPGHASVANERLTIATAGAPASSARVNGRPAISGTPTVWK